MQTKLSILVAILLLFLTFQVSAETSTLVGTWVATRPDGAQTVWQFNADGTVTAEFDGMEGFKGTWTLDTSKTPHPLDIVADDETVKTILEFQGNDSFKLEIGTADADQPRPEKFSDASAIFNRK